ncbi:MAG: formylglycine-generating enzyme family protein [Nitrospinae bacterium]|nr:formylglycine-generating enzyme family protein [Nitrospinota bacterium]
MNTGDRIQNTEFRIKFLGFLLLASCSLLITFYWNEQVEDVSVIPANLQTSPFEEGAGHGEFSEEMVEIPAGVFTMGSEDGEFDERPLHGVELDDFSMDQYEVIYLQYQRFILANPHWQKGNPKFDEADENYLMDWNSSEFPKGKENYPVIYVSWYAADAYARWAQKSLPTERQWEYAARGGYEGMRYVWGNNFETHLSNWRGLPASHSPPYKGGIMPVGSYSINGFGINDMAGNVWEWTSDGYELYMDGKENNPRPRLNNHLKVIRGGSWKSDKNSLRVSFRHTEKPNACRIDIGFRCVKRTMSKKQ